MSDSQKKPDQKKTSVSTKPSEPNATVRQAFEEANEKGYFGETPDETPNEAYTVAGVSKARKERTS